MKRSDRRSFSTGVMRHFIRHSPVGSPNTERRGSALLVVLVVIVMLSLAAYTYSELMLTEYHAANAFGRDSASRVWAHSGVEYVAALLTPDGAGWESNLYHNPALFHVPLQENGGFTIVAPLEDQVNATGAVFRMGLIDESSRLNLNTIANYDPADGLARNMLLSLPYMTETLADSILDWIDEDTEPREFGAEFDSYDVMMPRDGPIETLEELLLIQGVTPQLLYGEDANRNGAFDPGENDGALSLPYDNEDGSLDLGWSQFLTVSSKESNLQHAIDYYGQPRIDVNQSLLTDLYDQLEAELGADIAQFVTAYRLNGPNEEVLVESITDVNPLTGTGSGGSGQLTTGDETTDEALQSMAESMAGLLGGAEGSATRGGLELSSGGSVTVQSLFDLIGCEVDAVIDGQPTTLVSPWSADPGSLQQSLPEILDLLSVSSDPVITGRVNINQARREVLLGIPDMTPEMVDAIIANRAQRLTSGSTGTDRFATAGWLLIDGIVDLPTMRMLDRFVTARGNVVRMQVIGHADRPGPMTRIEAVLDTSGDVPIVIRQQDLGELGPGFRKEQLPRFEQAVTATTP